MPRRGEHSRQAEWRVGIPWNPNTGLNSIRKSAGYERRRAGGRVRCDPGTGAGGFAIRSRKHRSSRPPALMLVLFDNGTPRTLARYLINRHAVTEARARGWEELGNGELLAAAEAAGFEVLLTTDKNLRYQQNLTGRKIA